MKRICLLALLFVTFVGCGRFFDCVIFPPVHDPDYYEQGAIRGFPKEEGWFYVTRKDADARRAGERRERERHLAERGD